MSQIKITIEKSETVWKKSRTWNLMLDNPTQDQRQYDYVDAELPQLERVILLEQTLPSQDFDLKAVIKALNGL